MVCCEPQLLSVDTVPDGFIGMDTAISTQVVMKIFLKAEEICNEQGAYLADIITAQEGAWIKSVLLLINPKGIYNSYSSLCRDNASI